MNTATTSLIKLRLQADLANIDGTVKRIIEALTPVIGEPVEVSKPYPNRQPYQHQGQVYLTFATVDSDPLADLRQLAMDYGEVSA